MYDLAVFTDWAAFAVRWLHVITAMAWIGASFYFIALDLMLRETPDMPEGATGEEWEVHGGGFYNTVKYNVAPARLPEHLTWHKWQSYWTWLSGAALLAIVYWGGAEMFLIDYDKLELSAFQAILISAGSLTIGWILYDFLCKSPLGNHPTALMGLLFVILIAMAWGYDQVFTGRAALLHLGAFTATIMTANVFLIIMPNQRIVVKDLQEGRAPDAKYGKIAKLRSTHNNYLTLPVIFLMLSNHYPLAFATEYAWIIASLVFLLGVLIRHYFNSMHAGKGRPHWTWGVSAVIFVIIMWLSSIPMNQDYDFEAEVVVPEPVQYVVDNPHFEEVRNIVMGRCSMCHGVEPVWDGIRWAPRGLRLDDDAQIALNARMIYLHAGRSRAMPPGNVTGMTAEERAEIVEWYQSLDRDVAALD
ncbi:urate hydroxylase PuuD [Gymnodinialimonas ceratoperidinii]|uniref:Urate hydroxylase PuuD n=1 Tax=Gymnodinialimonas ceratoperidinii TaxID=2856823 RepID=A0A8F6YC53_9RHOB|nr:urate hydroxylase PuuD [Gymnodinialimonas ceratoperidinii]QXT41213.1 urate hydroxylase PuuD [Gymnodinialimonas ceratoperidinii]